MADSSSIPVWVQIVLGLGVPLGSLFGFVFGKASQSGADSTRLADVITRLESQEKILGATVITVSNHGISLQSTDARLSAIEVDVKTANHGIAQLLERTKRL